VGAFDEVPQRVLFAPDDVPMPHPVPGDVALPVDRVEVIVLPDARDVVRIPSDCVKQDFN